MPINKPFLFDVHSEKSSPISCSAAEFEYGCDYRGEAWANLRAYGVPGGIIVPNHLLPKQYVKLLGEHLFIPKKEHLTHFERRAKA